MKKVITSVKVTELGDTSLRLVELFKATELVQNDLFLIETFKELEEKAIELTGAIKKDVVSSQLDKADVQRDKAIRVLDRLLKGYEYIPLENMQVHAKKIIEVFKRYGVKITTENYSSQSNLITSLLKDLSQEYLKESIDALVGVKEAIEQIKNTQNDFARLRSSYEGALAQRKEKANATKLRKPILEIINKKIVPYLIAMNVAQPDVFKEISGKASEIISSTNDAVKSRKKKPMKEEKEVSL